MDHANHAGHAGHTMTTTTLAAAAAATTTAMSSMGSHGHHHGHGGGGGCKISMLWNWDAVGTCFISSTWHVTSSAVFAGSCIGVVLLVMVLELLRRSVKEYDRSLLRRHAARQLEAGAAPAASPGTKPGCDLGAAPTTTASAYRPAILEQAVRALLHMAQFAVAYFVMLLAMYFNGYIIICIFIGAYLGAFVFQWEALGVAPRTSAANEATVCCG